MYYFPWLDAAMSVRPRRLSALVLGSRRRRSATAAAVGVLALIQASPALAAADPGALGAAASVRPGASLLDLGGSVDTGSLDEITSIIHARDSWAAGYTGKGVDVALIDTGVAPVQGLSSGNVVDGPDLSFDSVHPDVRYKDAYGHGTHMASIIAGRDQAGSPSSYLDRTRFTGVAPDARIVNVKVGAADGAADVSQVIAAINWVTEHAHAGGLNIRVLNLSYGTPSGQDYGVDPLAYAVEN